MVRAAGRERRNGDTKSVLAQLASQAWDGVSGVAPWRGSALPGSLGLFVMGLFAVGLFAVGLFAVGLFVMGLFVMGLFAVGSLGWACGPEFRPSAEGRSKAEPTSRR